MAVTDEELDRELRGCWRAVRNFASVTFLMVMGVILVVLIVFGVRAALPTIQSWIAMIQKPSNSMLVYVASWIFLLVLSSLATYQINEIIRKSAANENRFRANVIAIMIALALSIFLFKQPFLDELFSSYTSGRLLKGILFGSGLGSGWLVWYLRQIRKYGEFFNVFLFAMTAGFCWYARLTAPEQVQLTAIAFLLGSLFHLAKDYLDKASELEKKGG